MMHEMRRRNSIIFSRMYFEINIFLMQLIPIFLGNKHFSKIEFYIRRGYFVLICFRCRRPGVVVISDWLMHLVANFGTNTTTRHLWQNGERLEHVY